MGEKNSQSGCKKKKDDRKNDFDGKSRVLFSDFGGPNVRGEG